MTDTEFQHYPLHSYQAEWKDTFHSATAIGYMHRPVENFLRHDVTHTASIASFMDCTFRLKLTGNTAR
jgi:hypothetical protein